MKSKKIDIMMFCVCQTKMVFGYEVTFVMQLLFKCENDERKSDNVRDLCKIYSIILMNNHSRFTSETQEDVENIFDFLDKTEIKIQEENLKPKFDSRSLLDYVDQIEPGSNYYMISLVTYYKEQRKGGENIIS